MKHFSLRLRIFLFFCLAAVGCLGAVALALWVGFRQLGDPAATSAFVTTGLIAVLGSTGILIFIWLLFDENVSKPVERIAASLRVRAHVDVSSHIDVKSARYLGDLAPAASAMGSVLENLARERAEKSKRDLAQLTTQRDQLVEILSDIPIATILASADHQVVLYDGQAAAIMDRVSAARLNASVFDYFDETPIRDALLRMHDTRKSRIEIGVGSRCGENYTGHIRAFEGTAGYTLMLEPLNTAAARPLTYDFELLTAARASTLSSTPLRDLTYVVFDTETTGLDPTKDEVVQLGAVRIVNGKIVTGEEFITYVNPAMKIPKRSTDVHGITDAMVADAPAFGETCSRFHSFAGDAVLVAHNAGFDMAFLHKQAPQTDIMFDQPVLDTVLMSAVVFGGSEVHTLDALCARLAITIPEDLRHTAMGDALATAQAVVAMLAIFTARGIETFGDLQAETQKHLRILKQ
ncbi:MAG: 3'-5' exonuclease [Sulfitobacter sp.]